MIDLIVISCGLGLARAEAKRTLDTMRNILKNIRNSVRNRNLYRPTVRLDNVDVFKMIIKGILVVKYRFQHIIRGLIQLNKCFPTYIYLFLFLMCFFQVPTYLSKA